MTEAAPFTITRGPLGAAAGASGPDNTKNAAPSPGMIRVDAANDSAAARIGTHELERALQRHQRGRASVTHDKTPVLIDGHAGQLLQVRRHVIQPRRFLERELRETDEQRHGVCVQTI